MHGQRIPSRPTARGERNAAQRHPRVRPDTPRRDPFAERGPGDIRLFLTAAPQADAETVAEVLASVHGFTRVALPPAVAGACACTSAERAWRLQRAADLAGRVVVVGVTCEEEARALRALGFVGVVVASTRTAAVCAATAAAGVRRAWGAHPDRRPVPPPCGGAEPRAEYLLDTGRSSAMAREHIAALVAVEETLGCVERPALRALEGATAP